MSFLDRLLGRTEPASKDLAKQRLQLVLVHDRARIPPALLEALRDELIATISKYVTIDPEGVRVSLDSASGHRLVADIPIISTDAPRRGNGQAATPEREEHKTGQRRSKP